MTLLFRLLLLLLVRRIVVVAATALPLNDINVVVLTDIHSYVGGREGRSNYDATYGDVLSFHQRLNNSLLVVNGDWIDGTGLAINGDPSHLIPILQKMPFDALNIGNHELYRKDVVEYMTRPGGFVDWWGDRYITSNVVFTDTHKPIGHRYKIIQQQQHYKLLVMGFLYNMQDNHNITTVEPVQSVIQKQWFTKVLAAHQQFDAILVLAHMDVQDELITVLQQAIRAHVPATMPLQFITGHTHYRGYNRIDNYTASFEPGHYLDTVGFCSFPVYQSNNSNSFAHRFIDASVKALTEALDVPELATPEGTALTKFINITRERLGLTEVVTTLTQSYYLNRSMEDDDSLYGLLYDRIVPRYFPDEIFVMNKGDLRFDLYEGPVTVDHLIQVSPFNESLSRWSDLPGHVLLQLQDSLNAVPSVQLPFLPYYLFTDGIDANSTYDMITNSYEEEHLYEVLREFYNESISMKKVENYTSSTILLYYFRETDGTSNTHNWWGGGGSHSNNKPKHTNPNGTNIGDIEDMLLDEENRDFIRLSFVLVASVVVSMVVVSQVQSRSKRWHSYVEAEEAEILQAQREADEEGFFL